MRQILCPLAAAAWLLVSLSSAPADEFVIRDGDTVGFLGDSITAAGVYGRHIENYTLLRYPDRKVRFLNLGIGGDTAAGGLKRLQRDVFDQNVTLLTVAFGVNDIGWGMKADDEHRQRYLDGIRGIVEACRERGVRVYICSAAVTGGDPDKTENNFLQRMCDEGLAIAREAGAGTIDVQRTMRDIQRRVRNANEGKPADQHETLHAADGVHLSGLGQLAMAYAILKGLGAPAEVSSCTIDAGEQSMVAADGCAISEITREGDSLSFVRLDEGLPFNNGLLATLSYRFVPMNELSRYRLTVRNLRTGRYGLDVDGREIGTWTAEQLAAGINIASTTPDPWQPGGPWDAQAGMLKSLTEARHNVQDAVRQARDYLNGTSLSEPFAEQSRQANEHIEQLQRQAARPRAYRFVLARLEDQTEVTSPLEYQVFQRTSAERGPVRVQGTTTLDADQVQLQVRGTPKTGTLPEGWQSVEFNPADGVFHKELTLPAGGWYALDLRFQKEGQPVHEQTIERFGVGEVFVGAGQSNSTNSGQFKTQQTSGMVASFSGEHWQLADDPQPGVADKSQGGSYYPAFGDRLYEVYKVPIGIAATGFGGTSVNQWQPPDGLFAWMMKRIDQLGPHGFRAVLWHQGESDVGMTSDEYYQKLKNVIETSHKTAGWEIPWFVAQVSYHNPDKPSFESTRTAQAKLWADGVALEGPDTDTLTGDHRDFDGKGIHFSPKGLKAHGLMWADKVRPWIDKALADAKVSSAAADDAHKVDPVRVSDDAKQFALGPTGE